MSYDLESVTKLLEHISHEINSLHRKVDQMSLDLSKLTASEEKLVTVVDQLLNLFTTVAAQVATLQANLIAANAANDTVGNAAMQSQLDGVQQNMDAEIAKVQASLASIVSTPTGPGPAPTGTTGPGEPPLNPPAQTVPSGVTGSTEPPAPPASVTGASGPSETGPSPAIGAGVSGATGS